MSIKKSVGNFFGLGESEYDEEHYEQDMYEEDAPSRSRNESRSSSPKENIIQFDQSQKEAFVVLIEPVTYADAQVIADNLKVNKSVLINLHKAQPDVSRRILDFVSGYIYSINGDIRNAGTNIFMATPSTYDISGSIENNGSYEESGWL